MNSIIKIAASLARVGLARTLAIFISLLPSQLSHANDSVTLRILTWNGYAPELQINQFKQRLKQQQGIELSLEVKYVSSSDDYFTALRSNSVDMIFPSHNVLADTRYKLIEKGLIIPIDKQQISNYQAVDPHITETLGQRLGNNFRYFIPLIYGPYGLIYNSDKVTTPPDSWKVLWQREYQQHYSINGDYYEANIYITALALGIDFSHIADIDTLKASELATKLNQLARHANSFWLGTNPVEKLEGLSLSTSWGFALGSNSTQAKHWKVACPKEGTSIWVDGVAFAQPLRDSPQKLEVAKELVNFMLDKPFQKEVVNHKLNSFTVNQQAFTELKTTKTLPPHYHCMDFKLLWPIMNKRQRNFMRHLWQRALEQQSRAS